MLIAWFAYFFLIQGVYNIVLVGNRITFGKNRHKTMAYFCLAAVLPFYYVIENNLLVIPSITFLLLIAAGVELVTLFIRHKKGKKADWLETRSIEILFQQLMLVILAANFPASQVALLFGVAHLPILFFTKIQDRVQLVILGFLAGYVFAALVQAHPLGYIASYAVHYAFYAILVWTSKPALLN